MNYPHSPGYENVDTSKAAAESIAPDVITYRQRVKAAIPTMGGATCDEVEVATGISHQSASARIRELVMLNQLFDSGHRRATRSGRSARVYLPYAEAA